MGRFAGFVFFRAGPRRLLGSIFATLVLTASAAYCAKPPPVPIPVMPLQEALEKAAGDKADGAAYYALAIHQARGKELKRDRAKAYAFLIKAVEAGYGPALYAYASARETRLKEESQPQGDLYVELGAMPWNLLSNSHKEESLIDEETATGMLDLYQRAADTGLASASNAVIRLKEKIARVRSQAGEAAEREKLLAEAYEKAKEENPGQIVRNRPGGTYTDPPLLDFDKAAALAEKGDAYGFYMLALHYARGKSVRADREKAGAFLKKASDGGNPAAMFLLACVEAGNTREVRRLTGLSFWNFRNAELNGFDASAYADEAFVNRITGLLEKARDMGVADATNAIAWLRSEHETALSEQTEKEGNARLAAGLEALIPAEFPKFSPMPFEEAVEKAANGDAEAYCSLAVHYARGDVVTHDRTKAQSCLKKAADLGSAIGLLLLGAARSDDYKIADRVAGVSPYSLGYFRRFGDDEGKAEEEAMSLYVRARDVGLPQATNAIARLEERIANRKAEDATAKKNEALEIAAGLNLPSDQARFIPLLVASGELDVEALHQWEVFLKQREARLNRKGMVPAEGMEADLKKIFNLGTNILSMIDLKLFSDDAVFERVAELALADGYDAAWVGGSANRAPFKTWSAGDGRKVAAWLGFGLARFSEDGRLESVASPGEDPWIGRAEEEIKAARIRQASEAGLTVSSCELLAGWIGYGF